MKTRQAAIAAVLLSLVCAPPALAQQALDFGPLDRIVLEELAQTRTPGAAVAVVQGDRVIYAKGFGLANVENEAPVTPDMLFRLGSTTKMFTATALVMLAEQGKIDLNEPVGTYVHGLAPRLSQITAHQLLSHTSGMLDEAPMFGSNDEDALAKEVRSWKDDRFFTEPGRIYSYSNPGYWFAGFLVESLSGKPYADQMAESVFKPLRMSRTTLRPMVAMTYPIAQGHDVINGRPGIVRPAANNAASWPAGSIFSSVLDLSRFVIAFMNGGVIDGKEVLSSAVIAKLQTPQVSIPGESGKYGYGLRIATMRGVRVVQHGGSRSGYGSTIRMVPERRFGVIILANRTAASLTRTADKAMEIVLSLPPDTEAATRAPMPMNDVEMTKYVGIYSQGGARLTEILKKDGKLFVKQGAQENELNKVGENELAYGELRIVLVPGTHGTIDFLYFGGRSWQNTKALRH